MNHTIQFQISEDDWALVSSSFLSLFESYSTTEPENNQPRLTDIYCSDETDIALNQNILKTIFDEQGLAPPDLSIEKIPEKDWLQEVFEQFKPIEIGRFWIYGSHEKSTPPADKLPLKIDAATAFGTGDHGTTKGCLLAIQDYFDPSQHTKILDMGCGSAILAMATAKLGGTDVLAADNDPESIRVTIENCKMNDCPTIQAHVSEGFENNVVTNHGPYDFILANILAGPLIALAPDFADHIQAGGTLILSGLLQDQEQDILAAYTQLGFEKIKDYPLDPWQTLVLSKVLSKSLSNS